MSFHRSLSLLVFLASSACSSGTSADPSASARRTVAVEVGARGYSPSEVTAAAGEQVRLVFPRTTDEGCGQQLVFPDLHLRRDLPLDEAVPVDLTMPASGTVAFTCGMGMLRGTVVVR